VKKDVSLGDVRDLNKGKRAKSKAHKKGAHRVRTGFFRTVLGFTLTLERGLNQVSGTTGTGNGL
jgi:hypothetical protein